MDKTSLYFVGLSASKKYIDDNGDHIKFKENKSIIYTGDEFTSVNGHVGASMYYGILFVYL